MSRTDDQRRASAPTSPTERNAGLPIAGGRRLIGPPTEVGRPVLSFAIPTYRRFDLLIETLESVFRLQLNIPVEILVVDNDPENDEQALSAMQRFRGKSFSYYKNNTNVGMFENWNRCLELSQGKYATILHDDDLLLPAFAEEINQRLGIEGFSGEILTFQCGILDQRINRPTAAGVSRLRKILSRISRWRSKSRINGIHDLFFANPFIGTLGTVLQRDKALSIGGFKPDWYPIADYEFWCRWTAHFGPIPMVKTRAGLYRMQQNESLLSNTRTAFITQSRALRESLIAGKQVPAVYNLVLNQLNNVQEAGINEDWRTVDENPVPTWHRIKFAAWRFMFKLLGRTGSLLTSVNRSPG